MTADVPTDDGPLLPARSGDAASSPPNVAADAADDANREAVERELGAQYQVVRSLGHGAAGIVYLGRDRVLHRLVAIKVLRAELAGLEEERERFRNEARLSVRLSHPGLVPIYTVGETPSLVYTVMQYVDGGSLADQVRRNGRATVHETVRLLLELADVLDYVHRQGVVHRDIKPENVLLAGAGPSARPVLGDFGVAAQPYRDQGVGRRPLVAGTAHYMSPEQLWGEVDVDRRSDIYSLGVLGYRLLAGVVPYQGPTAEAIAARRETQPHTPLRTAAAHVPGAVADVIEHCLARDPNDRWRNAREFATALARAQEGRPRWVRWMTWGR